MRKFIVSEYCRMAEKFVPTREYVWDPRTGDLTWGDRWLAECNDVKAVRLFITERHKDEEDNMFLINEDQEALAAYMSFCQQEEEAQQNGHL